MKHQFIDGVRYESEPIKPGPGRGGCDGCAGQDDYEMLCVKLGGCDGIIWVRKDAQPRPPSALSLLPKDNAARKATPIFSGVLGYFPLAIAAVAEVSRVGNEQHNPGQPLHWARGVSTDHVNCLSRHLLEQGTFDSDGVRHTAKIAWRALAMLQVEIERANGLFLDDKPVEQPSIAEN
jgi:hypothetical protein